VPPTAFRFLATRHCSSQSTVGRVAEGPHPAGRLSGPVLRVSSRNASAHCSSGAQRWASCVETYACHIMFTAGLCLAVRARLIGRRGGFGKANSLPDQLSCSHIHFCGWPPLNSENAFGGPSLRVCFMRGWVFLLFFPNFYFPFSGKAGRSLPAARSFNARSRTSSSAGVRRPRR
jgi:hypothetical protein